MTLFRVATISIKELHERTGEWVRKAESEEITVTDRGKPVAQLLALSRETAAIPRVNRFLNRKLRPGFAELQKRLTGGTDSTQIISEDRDRA